MTGRWKARKSNTTLFLPSHRPLEISPNTARFPHSHPTADDKIETLLTDSKKPQLDEKCQPCARSVVSTMSPAAQFGYRPYGPRSDLRSIFEFPHSPFSPCYGASGTKPLSRDNSQQCTVFSARSQRKNPGAKALIAVFFYGPTKVVP
jgi:hypothetical protein